MNKIIEKNNKIRLSLLERIKYHNLSIFLFVGILSFNFSAEQIIVSNILPLSFLIASISLFLYQENTLKMKRVLIKHSIKDFNNAILAVGIELDLLTVHKRDNHFQAQYNIKKNIHDITQPIIITITRDDKGIFFNYISEPRINRFPFPYGKKNFGINVFLKFLQMSIDGENPIEIAKNRNKER